MEFDEFLRSIVACPKLHSQWLNTLSYWENCGARKLAAYENPTKVKQEMLKHASEEFRHAHYLKQQLHRLPSPFLIDYAPHNLIGGHAAYRYLDRLEMTISRLKLASSLTYLLISYAIETRAEEVYGIYQKILKETKSPIRVQSILLEEQEHLAEIKEELSHYIDDETTCQVACHIETQLYSQWLTTALKFLEKFKLLSLKR